MHLAVVGAGVAGAGAAYALREADVEATLFEERDRVGGRTATRRRSGCRYDTGANYVKHADGRPTAFLRNLGTEGLVDVGMPVWTFTADGTVSEGDRPSEDRHKWTYEAGIETLASRLVERADAEPRLETPVGGVDRGDGWTLRDPDGGELGRFDAVLLTPPGPATADLLPDGDGRIGALRDAASAVPYRPIRTLALHYPFELDRPYYALVNVDREHAVGWLSREECKAGHVPDGESLLIVQMAPDWSAENAGLSAEEAAGTAADHAADLLGDDRLRDPDWTDDHGWTRALPDGGVSADVATGAEPLGLFVAGDWVAGEGRVHLALRSGLDAGERIADRS